MFKLNKLSALVAAAGLSFCITAGPAHAHDRMSAFSFSYSAAEIAGEDGGKTLDRRLKREARHYCRQMVGGRGSVSARSICQARLVKEVKAELKRRAELRLQLAQAADG